MAINPSKFQPLNVTDTCSVWNILSATRLFQAAQGSNCEFCCTSFVIYECLHKKRSKETAGQTELKRRLVTAQATKQFVGYSLDIADLQSVEILQKRKNLGKGELSSIAYAMKTRQAFLTDDRKARKLAAEVMTTDTVQTTPHLYGWLHFTYCLSDGDHDPIMAEHVRLERDIKEHFVTMYHYALQCRLTASAGQPPQS